MSNEDTSFRPKARLPRGLKDERGPVLAAQRRMLDTIRGVYELYGFEPLETSAFEYSDCLGKFLPDQERPNAGVFSIEDDDGQWMSLRYDLTAPLARFVAQNFDELPKPFRRYQTGTVWRNEKPGPGRFREFIQFDADTVGSPLMAADAEMAMLVADTLEALGIARGDFVVKVNNRKILDGVLARTGLGADDPGAVRTRLTVLRAIDKLDRLGLGGVEELLREGRKDESGDFTPGAKLDAAQARVVLDFLAIEAGARGTVVADLAHAVAGAAAGEAGVAELAEIGALLEAAGYAEDRVRFDPGIVRGLEYYTGPVLEAELTFATVNDRGEHVRFGSVASGGRYDGLVERFKGAVVPATGCSIGVSRLLAALAALGKAGTEDARGPVVVLVMDREAMAGYQTMVSELRAAGIPAELYLGGSGMKAQVKYADKRGSPIAVIEGGDERARGEVTLKDLVLGAELAAKIKDNAEWRAARPAQLSVPRTELVARVREMMGTQAAERGEGER